MEDLLEQGPAGRGADDRLVGQASGSLYRLTDRLYRATSPSDVFDAALDAIVETLGCDRASILLFDADGVMRFTAWRGLSEAYRIAVDGHSPWRPGDRDPAPIFVGDIDETSEPEWLKRTIHAEGIRALGFVPLVRSGSVVGKFMTYFAQPRRFSAEEMAVAVMIARQVGFSLERAEADRARLAAEEELRQSERRFRMMADEAPVMIWISDAEGGCLHLNRMLRGFWGVSEDRVPVFDWRDTLHPADAPEVAATMGAAIAERRSARVKARYRCADGRYRVLSTDAHPQFSASGEFKGFIGVNVDVTEREEADRALRASERRFRDLAETMPQLVWTSDAAGTVDYWNGRIGQYRDGADGGGRLTWQHLVHVDDLARTTEAWAASVAAAHAFQVTHRLNMADGSSRWHLSRATPVFGEDGAIARWFGTATDVHDLRTAETRLRESEQRQRVAAWAAGLGIFEWNVTDDRAIWENARMYQLFGMDRSEPPLTPKEFRNRVVHPDDRACFDRAIADAQASGDTIRVVFRVQRGDEGEIRWLEMAGRVDLGEAATTRRIVGVLADVTDRARDEELRQLLIHELNHRVKNNLAVVQGIARRTFGRGDDDPRVGTFEGRLQALAAAHDHLASENWTRADLGELARRALFATEAESRIAVSGPRIELGPKPAVAVTLALHELFTNALKYGALSVPDGRVQLSWEVSGADTPVLGMRWVESGGPRVSPPTRQGFGSVVIGNALRSELDADVRLDFRPEGLVWSLTAKLPRSDWPAWGEAGRGRAAISPPQPPGKDPP